jgi:hypothetical protein
LNPLDHYLQHGIYKGRTVVNDGLWGRPHRARSRRILAAAGGCSCDNPATRRKFVTLK